MTSMAEANDSMILRPKEVATKFDVSATYIPCYIKTNYVRWTGQSFVDTQEP